MPAAAVTVKDVDRGWARVFRDLTAATPSFAAVGILGEAAQSVHTGEHETNTPPTVLDVAIWNEFGLGVPERSFLRETIAMRQREVLDLLVSEMRAVVDGKSTKARAYQRVGIFVVSLVQQRIAAGIQPPNAPSTVEKKGGGNTTPLIDTGQLRSSITFEVR